MPRSTPQLPLTVGTALVPLGIGLWFAAMHYGFSGAGSWTVLLAYFGIALVPVGLLFKLSLIAWARMSERRLPSWFWVDLAFWGIIGLLFLSMFLRR